MLLRAVDGIIIYLLPFNTDLSTILPTLNYSGATSMDYALSTIDPQRLATPKLRVKNELRTVQLMVLQLIWDAYFRHGPLYDSTLDYGNNNTN